MDIIDFLFKTIFEIIGWVLGWIVKLLMLIVAGLFNAIVGLFKGSSSDE